jgi:hypothetical protein
MTATVPMQATQDRTDLPTIVRSGVKLGLLQCALIAAFAVLEVRLDGTAEFVVCGLILLAGIAATIVLPGLWTRARTIEGIAGAAGIGLAAAWTFLIVDIVLFQPVHLYTNRWLEIGGGSNWWYHPVWWMVGTYLTWQGAWIQANQAARSGNSNPAALVVNTVVLAVVCLSVAMALHIPNAAWGLGGFAVGVLPALAILTALTALRVPRR